MKCIRTLIDRGFWDEQEDKNTCYSQRTWFGLPVSMSWTQPPGPSIPEDPTHSSGPHKHGDMHAGKTLMYHKKLIFKYIYISKHDVLREGKESNIFIIRSNSKLLTLKRYMLSLQVRILSRKWGIYFVLNFSGSNKLTMKPHFSGINCSGLHANFYPLKSWGSRIQLIW